MKKKIKEQYSFWILYLDEKSQQQQQQQQKTSNNNNVCKW
jgi:hypothetical protein